MIVVRKYLKSIGIASYILKIAIIFIINVCEEVKHYAFEINIY